MGKLILVRHGETDLNRDKVFFGRLNPILNSNGIQQANKTRESMKKINYDYIFSSPLKRASETANIINVKDLEIKEVEELLEINFGIFEGLTYQEICEKFPEDSKRSWDEWKTYNFQIGESPIELQKRAVSFIKSLDLKKDNLVVTHWGVISTILSYYFSVEVDSYWKFGIKNGGIVIISFEDNFPVLEAFNIGVL